MTHKLLAVVGLFGAVITFIWVAPGLTSGQTPAEIDQSWSPKLLSDGQPDIQGIYINPWPFSVE